MHISQKNPEFVLYRAEIICFEWPLEKRDNLLIRVATWIRNNINSDRAVVNFDGVTSLNFETTLRKKSIPSWIEDALNTIEPYYTGYSIEVFDL